MTSRNTTARNRGSIRAGGRAAKLALAIALASAPIGVALAAATGVTIEKPWIRLIIKARPAAGYFTLKNDGNAPIELTGAASTACGMVMLHQSKEVNGVEKMLPVKSVTVPAHGSLSFAPGGYHLMCTQPQSSMQIGHSVPMTLKFAGGGSITAQFPVKGAGGQ
jgi:copper(I)-binding protein